MTRAGACKAGIGLVLALGVVVSAQGAGFAAPKHHPHPGPEGITVAPAAPKEIPGDSVGFAVAGAGWYPNESVGVWAPGLSDACAANGSWLEAGSNAVGAYPGASIYSDSNGRFLLSFTGADCPPGNYVVRAGDQASPYRRTSTMVTIAAPAGSKASVSVGPASQPENDLGDVATSLEIQGFTPGETVTVDAPKLAAACASDSDVWFFDNGSPANPPDSVTLDDDGGAVLGVTATSCVAGTYQITVTEPSGAVRKVAFTVAPL